MHTDVTVLRDFYQTPLGLVVRRILGQKIRARWPKLAGEALAGFGFASPFLGSFRGETSCTCALMPEGQGALVWPSADRNMTVLVEEDFLPLPDNSIDRLIVVHALEVAERPAALLREFWRVLKPSGRLLVLVPNRSGVWARTDRTPFGQGRPYSRGQLEELLRAALFTPVVWDSALFLPPIHRALLVRSAPTIERIGARISPRFAGVIIVEATKELIQPIGSKASARSLGKLMPIHSVLTPNGVRRTPAPPSRRLPRRDPLNRPRRRPAAP